ncbi:serine/threonine-protein kinase [Streptosporangium sp. NPDC051022]|uniref:serine/threonine-protein kinase n=1 Tax=Streptosporangium sp. NPDC051022 TaxID=3155752 RepID=UPI003446E604
MSHQYGPSWHGQPPPPRSNTGLSVVWALVPLFTCGMGTPFIMAHAARKLRSPLLALSAAFYALGIGVFIVAISAYDDTDLIPGWLNAVMTIGLFASWIGGLGHALIIRGSVFQQDPQGPRLPGPGVLFPPPVPVTPAVPYPTAPTVASSMHAPAHPPQPHHTQTHHPQTHAQTSHPQPHHTQTSGTPRGWLGPYRLIGDLGKGGQGTVHLALTPQGQKVAIKVLHQHLTGNQMVRERFLREVEATRKVATFSTARVLDVNITDDQAYIVSEFVDGVSLEQLVRDQGPRNEDGLTRLALATAGALAAIHKAGVVHRDFKPANVLIGADGPRVIDFGIARALDQVTATSGNIMGTPAYMSPEQLAGGAIGPESDVFSWAATMIFAASGRAAFGDDTIPAILNRVINHHPDLSALPQSLRPLAATCLDKQPGNRPTAADIMLRIVH